MLYPNRGHKASTPRWVADRVGRTVEDVAVELHDLLVVMKTAGVILGVLLGIFIGWGAALDLRSRHIKRTSDELIRMQKPIESQGRELKKLIADNTAATNRMAKVFAWFAEKSTGEKVPPF